jgi:hypothetical protein
LKSAQFSAGSSPNASRIHVLLPENVVMSGNLMYNVKGVLLKCLSAK